MKDVKIEFVSTQGKGFAPDLRLLKQYFIQREEINPVFSFYMKPLSAKNDLVRSAILSGRRVFCEGTTNLFCVDGSLPTDLRKNAITANKTLFLVPTDFHFKPRINKKELIARKKSYEKFVDVISGCKFIDDLVKNKYKIPQDTITNMPLPLNWALSHTSNDEVLNIREDYEKYFPQMKGKRIIYLIVSNVFEMYEFENFDLKSFLDSLPEDVFLLTNSTFLYEESNVLDYKHLNKFGYIKNFNMFNPLFFVDCLITNQANFATAFASTKKKLFCIKQCKNFFEGYMKKNFSNLYIEKINEFNQDNFFNDKFDNDIGKFCSLFTYNDENNPFEYSYNNLKY